MRFFNFLFFTILFLIVCSFKFDDISKTDSSYEDVLNQFSEIEINSSRVPSEVVEEFFIFDNTEYSKSINATGIVSFKLLIDTLGRINNYYNYNSIDKKLKQEILSSLRSSRFKILYKSTIKSEYSIIVTYIFDQGKILCPYINGVPYSNNYECQNEKDLEFFNADVKPKIIKKIAPVYPTTALEAKIEGISVVTISISKNGDVIYAQVLKSVSRSLDHSSLDAAMMLKFKPGKENGELVNIKMNIPFHFKLQ